MAHVWLMGSLICGEALFCLKLTGLSRGMIGPGFKSWTTFHSTIAVQLQSLVFSEKMYFWLEHCVPFNLC